MKFNYCAKDSDLSVSPQFKEDYDKVYQILGEFVNSFQPVKHQSQQSIWSIIHDPSLYMTIQVLINDAFLSLNRLKF